jgi:hypothetical protein
LICAYSEIRPEITSLTFFRYSRAVVAAKQQRYPLKKRILHTVALEKCGKLLKSKVCHCFEKIQKNIRVTQLSDFL